MDSQTKIVARVNGVSILLVENGEKRVAIKPICEALGVSVQGQLERLKEDPILGSVIKLSLTTGSDGKDYQMQTIPFKYVFGWLFRIDSRNVKEEAKELVLNYQVQCYDALYRYFTLYAEFVETKQKAIDSELSIYETANDNFSKAKNVLNDSKKRLRELRQLTFEDYDAESRQLKIFTDEEMEKGGDNHE